MIRSAIARSIGVLLLVLLAASCSTRGQSPHDTLAPSQTPAPVPGPGVQRGHCTSPGASTQPGTAGALAPIFRQRATIACAALQLSDLPPGFSLVDEQTDIAQQGHDGRQTGYDLLDDPPRGTMVAYY